MRISAKAYNAMLDAAEGYAGQKIGSFTIPKQNRNFSISGGGGLSIAKVIDDADGGGYYNCYLQTLDATDWNSDTADQLDDTGDSILVLNLCEVGVDVHNLDAGDLIVCWTMDDDEGNLRYVGIEVQGRHDFGEV